MKDRGLYQQIDPKFKRTYTQPSTGMFDKLIADFEQQERMNEYCQVIGGLMDYGIITGAEANNLESMLKSNDPESVTLAMELINIKAPALPSGFTLKKSQMQLNYELQENKMIYGTKI